jgi:hypothetical protein
VPLTREENEVNDDDDNEEEENNNSSSPSNNPPGKRKRWRVKMFHCSSEDEDWEDLGTGHCSVIDATHIHVVSDHEEDVEIGHWRIYPDIEFEADTGKYYDDRNYEEDATKQLDMMVVWLLSYRHGHAYFMAGPR